MALQSFGTSSRLLVLDGKYVSMYFHPLYVHQYSDTHFRIRHTLQFDKKKPFQKLLRQHNFQIDTTVADNRHQSGSQAIATRRSFFDNDLLQEQWETEDIKHSLR